MPLFMGTTASANPKDFNKNRQNSGVCLPRFLGTQADLQAVNFRLAMTTVGQERSFLSFILSVICLVITKLLTSNTFGVL